MRRLTRVVLAAALVTGSGMSALPAVAQTPQGQWTTVRPDEWSVVSSSKPKQPDHNRETPVTVGLDGLNWDVSRAFFEFDLSPVRGKQIFGAKLYLDMVGTGSCQPSAVELWRTGPVDSGTSWNTQPEWLSTLDSRNESWGAAGCPVRSIGLDATKAVAEAADSGRVTLGLRAGMEWDRGSWKAFGISPRLTMEYNSVPEVPDRRQVDIMDCPEPPGELLLYTPAPALRARLSDVDGGMLTAEFEWWSGGARVGGAEVGNIPSGSVAKVTVPSGVFAHESVFSWRVRAKDDRSPGPWSAWCGVRVDAQPPHSAPGVFSAEYPEGEMQPGPPKKGTFVFSPNGVTDVVEYRWSVTTGELGRAVPGPDGTASMEFTPRLSRPLWLEVFSLDAAGNQSPVRSYEFGVRRG